MPDIRLVALDLDGTLLDPKNQVSEEDARAVRQATEAGVRVVLATSRWYHAARRTAVQLGIAGPIICHNGALVRDSESGREVLHLRIDLELAKHLAAHIDTLDGDAYVTVDDRTFVRSKRARDPSRLPPDMVVVSSLADAVTAAPTAFLVFGKDSVRSVVEMFREHHGVKANLAEGFSESFPDYLNVVHPSADKGGALRAVAESLAIPMEQTMAVGDAGPDVAMIKLAGLGVAMGNAAPEVKAAADAIAPGNDASGVAWAINRFVLGA